MTNGPRRKPGASGVVIRNQKNKIRREEKRR
jgi:hypothetical protein